MECSLCRILEQFPTIRYILSQWWAKMSEINIILETLRPQESEHLVLQITGRLNQLSYLLETINPLPLQKKLIYSFINRLRGLNEDLLCNKYNEKRGMFFMSLIDEFLNRW